ncbi:MAG: HNH endonuclease [Saprospiraceae bacterium]|nr:HNH endonuclease [Saprospiraceae bacterium]
MFDQFTKYRTKDELKIHKIWDRSCKLRPSGELNGDHDLDFKAINKKMGFGESKDGHLAQFPDYIWHHHEDGKTLMLVPKNLNNPGLGGLSHTGGKAVIEHNLDAVKNDIKKMILFPSPQF